MSSTGLPQPQSSAARPPAVGTPVKQQPGSLLQGTDQHNECPYGSPITGVCTTAPVGRASRPAAANGKDAGAAQTPHSMRVSGRVQASLTSQCDGQTASATPQHLWLAASQPAGTPSMRQQCPELQPSQQHGQLRQMRLSADNRPRRDQDLCHSSQGLSPRSSQAGSPGLQHSLAAGASSDQPLHQPLLPLDVLLSPLLPSADESKLVDRLSQLRHALDEHMRLAAGWEQQAVTLQQAVSEVQGEALVLRGQLASQQHHISLLGGNLQGRLSLVQGNVLAQLQEQAAQKDAALAGSAQHVLAIQAELEKLSCSFTAKLAAEQAERQRLAAEAAQARLLCTARGRQVSSLQQELQQLKDAASQQQQAAAAGSSLQQQQLEGMQQRLQAVQQQLAAAQQEASEAEQVAAAAEGGKAGLRQQVDELQALLAEKQLQVDWLEGKVADMEGSDISQQLRRHHSEVTRLQETAAADRRTFEQQLGAAQLQVSQLQQQEEAWRQHEAQLEQQVQGLQQQLEQQQYASHDLEQQLQQYQQQQAHDAQGALAEQLAAADAEVQQLRDQLAEAEEEIAALTQQLQQQQQQQQLHAQAAINASADAADEPDGSCSQPSAAVVHALRAELGIANAEVARLRHQMDVAQTSQQQERELTGHEILRLQQELSEAAASGSVAAAGAASPAGDAGVEVTSRLGTQRVGSDSTGSWHSVHDNPAFEQHNQQVHLQSHAGTAAAADEPRLQQQLLQGQPGVPEAAAEGPAVAAAKLSRYDAKLQDQAETISSLQRQLKQQEQLLAALQKRERRVFDSAASRSSWAEALGFEEHPQHHQHLPDPTLLLRDLTTAAAPAGGAAGSVSEPATPHADAAVQTDLSGPAESAGSTAAAPAATASEGMGQTSRQQQEQQASSRQPQAAAAADAAASSALLAAARHEILRLQELNRQLMQAHAEELKASVSFADARRAVAEVKQHAKAKAAAMLQAGNKTWSDKLAAARAEVQLLQEQLHDLQQQQDTLQQQLSAASNTHSADVVQLQQELSAAQEQNQALTRQLQAMADAHMRELEQVRMEVEDDAAAAMLDAAAASNQVQQQQQQSSRQLCHAGVQTDAGSAVQFQDAAAQTDLLSSREQQPQLPPRRTDAAGGEQQQLQQQWAASCGSTSSGSLLAQCDGNTAEGSLPQQQQPQHKQVSAGCYAAAGDERPCTPQPSATASPAAGMAAAMAAGTTDSCDTPMQPAAHAASSTPGAPQSGLAATWRMPGAVGAGVGAGCTGDVGDDDICRFSSASDTPASASSRGPVSRIRGSMGTAGGDAQRPGSAGAVSLPELTATSSPVPPAAARHGLPAEQQQQLLATHPQQPPQFLQQKPQQQLEPLGRQQTDNSSVQMSSWHAELIQQQVELEALKVRLSQQQQQHHQQQHPWRPGLGGSSSKASPAVANSRTLLMAPFGPSVGGAGVAGSAGSPAGPVFSSSSPMTYQQRRAAAAAVQQLPAASLAAQKQQEAADVGIMQQTYAQQLYSRQSVGTAAEQWSGQVQPKVGAAGGDAEGSAILYRRWRSSSSPEGLSNSVLLGSPQVAHHHTLTGAATGSAPGAAGAVAAGIVPAGAGAAGRGAPGSASASGWGLSLMAAAGAGRSVRPLATYTTATAAAYSSRSSRVSAAGVDNTSDLTTTAAGSSAAAAGLSKLGDDVLGALSLSRYHRERSKLQEARAKQHALLASHHEDQAAVLRNSRLGGPLLSQAGAAASATPATAAASGPGGPFAAGTSAAGQRPWPGGL